MERTSLNPSRNFTYRQRFASTEQEQTYIFQEIDVRRKMRIHSFYERKVFGTELSFGWNPCSVKIFWANKIDGPFFWVIINKENKVPVHKISKVTEELSIHL